MKKLKYKLSVYSAVNHENWHEIKSNRPYPDGTNIFNSINLLNVTKHLVNEFWILKRFVKPLIWCTKQSLNRVIKLSDSGEVAVRFQQVGMWKWRSAHRHQPRHEQNSCLIQQTIESKNKNTQLSVAQLLTPEKLADLYIIILLTMKNPK